MEVIVERHCVAQGETGLSPLQQALIEDPHRVRIAAAPTGAGKSYAFQRAMSEYNQRILLIVPTRRLAQNLAAGLVQELAAQEGWDRARAERRVAIWSSDQTMRLKQEGVTSVSGVRLRQMHALVLGSDRGEMIVAIPEVVSGLLTQRKLEPGVAGKGVFDLLDDFDHIVFDEFHTIEPRGFGLAALLARLVTVPLDNRVGYGEAKISFLSATPLDLAPTLTRFGVPNAAIARLAEEILAQGRALHGDVRLTFIERDRLREVIVESLPEILAAIGARNQVVVIYNALADLEKDLHPLARSLAEAGVAPRRVLVINSIRDSVSDGRHECGFLVGRQRDPADFDLILATASVEIGVTFRAANLMLMEPGFFPMNFLQRYGRAARRGADGQVVVRLDKGLVGGNPWLRDLQAFVGAHDGERISIADLSGRLSLSVQADFAGDESGATFGRLAKPAPWCAGLYWQVLMDHPSNRGHRKGHLFAQRPAAVKKLYRLEQAVRALEQDPDYARSAKHWLTLLRAQVLDLRSIEPRMDVIQGNGDAFSVGRVWLHRETSILDRFSPVGDEVRISGALDDYWREEKNRDAKRTLVCYFPHTGRTCELPVDHNLPDTWCRQLRNIDPQSFALDDHPAAIDAAERLVRLTGLVPGHDPDISLDAINGIL